MVEFKDSSFPAFCLLLFALPPAPASRAQSYAPPEMVYRLEVRRMPLDIVITDKDGKTVRGLTKNDFIIKEDQKTRKAITFEYLDASSKAIIPPKLAPLPVNTFVNLPTEPERGPLYVLYYDMVNTSLTDQMEAHTQLLDFVDHAEPGTRFALFGNMAGLHMVQAFTSDRERMHGAILSKGPSPHLPNVFLDGDSYGHADPGAELSNLKFLADYLRGIPGRKNLLWLSGVFPIPVGPTMTGHNSNTGVGGGFSSSTMQINDLTYLLQKGIKETYAALAASQVALYPIDLKGVGAGGDTVVDNQHIDDIAAATGSFTTAFRTTNPSPRRTSWKYCRATLLTPKPPTIFTRTLNMERPFCRNSCSVPTWRLKERRAWPRPTRCYSWKTRPSISVRVSETSL